MSKNLKKGDSVITLNAEEAAGLEEIKKKYAKLSEQAEIEYLKNLKFKQQLDDPKVRVAARKAVIGLDALMNLGGLRVYDWSIHKDGIDAEIENADGEKKWIHVGRLPKEGS